MGEVAIYPDVTLRHVFLLVLNPPSKYRKIGSQKVRVNHPKYNLRFLNYGSPFIYLGIINMSKFGRLSHFLDLKKRKEIVGFLLGRKNEGKYPIFKLYQSPSKFTAAAFDLMGQEPMLKYLNMVRKGRLVLLLDFQNRWDEEDNFEYRIHMDTDVTTLNIHLAKIDDGDIDYPLTVLRDEADLFLYTLE